MLTGWAQIEFPSILLPPDISSGSIVDIAVSRNTASEQATERAFQALQDRIFNAFGASEPAAPVLRLTNATQTSVVLEWDPIQLATADLISLSLYRNNQKAGQIPRPTQMSSTKISGLAVDTEYTFHLVLRTTAGVFTSDRVAVRTHKMTDLSGVTITTGILPAAMRDRLARAVERVGARLVDGVRIDTTHFVTTEGRGLPWEKAVENNIPVVRPEWVEACEKSGRILGVTKFYLDALRPGPMGDEAPSAVVPQPTASSPPAQKDLPVTPKDTEPETPSTVDGKKAAEEDEDDEDDDEEEEEAEQKAISTPRDEQKVRREDKDEQKVALRPGQPGRHLSSGSGSGRSGDGEPGDAKTARVSADSQSFQTVDL